MKKQTELILEAYSILENVTPLKYDCGSLCSRHCCKNNGKDGETLGMWLLPYEIELLSKCKEYTFSKTGDGVETVFCTGKCNRELRPFACRIYPFYAHIEKLCGDKEKITVKADPRARLSCPIVMYSSYLRPNIYFISAVKDAVRVLLKDEKIKRDLYEQSEFLSDIEDMQNKFYNSL